MKLSGKTTSLAPCRPASAIRSHALATVAARSRKMGAACTTAALNTSAVLSVIFAPPHSGRRGVSPGKDVCGLAVQRRQHFVDKQFKGGQLREARAAKH